MQGNTDDGRWRPQVAPRNVLTIVTAAELSGFETMSLHGARSRGDLRLTHACT
jgi:hypothetical protein